MTAAGGPLSYRSDFQVFGHGNVRPHRVRFEPADPAFLSLDADGRLTYRLLGPHDITEGVLLTRVEGAVLGFPLEQVGAAGGVSLWQAVIEPPARAFDYSFALRLDDGAALYIAPTGVASGIERLDRFHVVVADVPVHAAPPWAAGAVIYQIFPDRFANGDASTNPPDVAAWAAPPARDQFKGGDLVGIAHRVDYLESMGVDVVYLNPVFASPSNHRYDTVDYRAVDPLLGGEAALREMIDALHGRGIRVLLDVSLNHVHPRFFAFSDLVERGPRSPYSGWFAVSDWPVRAEYRPELIEPGGFWDAHLQRLQEETGVPVHRVGGDGPAIETTYESWYGVPTMPRVNLQDPGARRYMLDVTTHWVREHDIDGWRMDVVRYIDHDFWHEVRREVRSVKPDALLLAEVMGDARRWLYGDEFDATMNYTFRDLSIDYFAKGAIGTPRFLEGFLEMTAMYSPAVTAMNHNLLGSHDMPRFLTEAGGDADRMMLATLFQLTVPGAPGLYYGDELPMEGGPDPDNRRGFDWDAVGGAHQVAVRELLRVRRASPALRTGVWRLLAHEADAFAYERVAAEDGRVVVINTGDDAATLSVAGPSTPDWAHGEVRADRRGITIGRRSGAVLRRR